MTYQSSASAGTLLIALTAAALGCGAAPREGSPAAVPAGAIRVVPASQVIGACTCAPDDDVEEQWLPEHEAAPARGVEYVKLSEWSPPPQVVAVEAMVPPRGNAPLTFTSFPRLTGHGFGSGSLRGRRR